MQLKISLLLKPQKMPRVILPQKIQLMNRLLKKPNQNLQQKQLKILQN
jgi:hypothetical protein